MKINLKVSDAFPNNFKGSDIFSSKIHNKLKGADFELLEDSLIFYNYIRLDDLDEIRSLHNEWFPINYRDHFYQKIFRNQVKIILIKGDVLIKNTGEKINSIVGLVTYRVEHAKNEYLRFWQRIQNLLADLQNIHICTLGVLYEFRKHKLGSKLINMLIEEVKYQNKFQYLVLETADYNKTAIKFYLKNNFELIETKKNFYLIDGNEYDAIILLKRLN